MRRGKEVTHIKIQNNGDFFDLYGGESMAFENGGIEWKVIIIYPSRRKVCDSLGTGPVLYGKLGPVEGEERSDNWAETAADLRRTDDRKVRDYVYLNIKLELADLSVRALD